MSLIEADAMVAPLKDRAALNDSDEPTIKSAVDSLVSAKDGWVEYARAELARLIVIARSVAFFAVLGLIGAVVGLTTLVCATAMIVYSLAVGIGKLFGHQEWLGFLIVGLVVVGSTVAALLLVMKKMNRDSRKKLVTEYEQRLQHR